MTTGVVWYVYLRRSAAGRALVRRARGRGVVLYVVLVVESSHDQRRKGGVHDGTRLLHCDERRVVIPELAVVTCLDVGS